MSKKTMISPKRYAEAVGRPYTTIMTWLQNGLLPDAIQLETPSGNFWAIPEGTKPPDLKPGPKPGIKKANEAEAIEATRVSAPVTPAKKRATKKGSRRVA
jgi:hypothetical protein